MAANKNKIVALAQRYTGKGQFEKAIAEYRKLLKTDPGDIRTWLKIGDLYTRMGARKEATETYIRVAEQYTNSGFHLKAVAVYKQVLNIDPTLVVIHQYLAASYLELGLTSEALIQLEQLADIYERTARNDLLLEVLLQMGKIDSHNIATRLRIAELLSKENRVMEAAKHFALACEELKTQGRREDFVKVAERLLYHDPSRVDIALEVASVYIDKSMFKEALSKLQVCFVKNRKNIDVLNLLAKAFLGLGQPEKAVSVMTEIAQVLEAEGDEARRMAILEEILTIDPENETALAGLGRKSSPNLEAGGESLHQTVLGEEGDIISEVSPSSGIDLLEDLTAAESMTSEEIAGQSQERLNEVKVLLKYGLKDRALEHLQKLFDVDPYNIEGRETARDILLALGRREEALNHLFLLADVFKAGQPEGSIYYLHEVLKADRNNLRARQMIRDLGGIMPEGLEDDASVPVVDEDELPFLEDDEDILLIDDDDLQQADAVMPDTDDLDMEWDDWDVPSEPPPKTGGTSAPIIDLLPEISTALPPENTTVEVMDCLDGPLDADIDEILLEDDDTFGDGKEVRAEFDPTNQDDINRIKKESEEKALSAEIEDDLQEIDFFIDQELFDEARAALLELSAQYPNDPRVSALAARLPSESDATADEAPQSEMPSDKAPDMPSGFSNNEGSVQFKHVGIKEKLSDSDSATTWDLGLAYKEMGLFEDAIQAFEIASRDSTRTAAAKTMLGMCYASLSRMDKAVQTFNEGLAVADIDDNKKMGLLYELGKTYQMMGKRDDALRCYERIHEIDDKFADVADRLRAIVGAPKTTVRM